MSEKVFRQAGFVRVKALDIKTSKGKTIDIKLLAVKFNIQESITTGSLRGAVSIIDANSLLDDAPIEVGDLILISYSDYFDRDYTQAFQIYRISDINYPDAANEALLAYTLHFTSPEKLAENNTRIRKAYNTSSKGTQLISDYVQDIFDEYYKPNMLTGVGFDKNIMIEPTSSDQIMVVPNYSPENTMHFMSRYAFNNTTSSLYMFYENRKGYFFTTSDYLYTLSGDPSKMIVYRDKDNSSRSPQIQDDAMSYTLDIKFGDGYDAADIVSRGGFRRKTYEIDLLTLNVHDISYAYDNEYPVDISEDFRRNRMNHEREFFVIKDYASPGWQSTDTMVANHINKPELINEKSTYLYNRGVGRVTMTVHGRNDLLAGNFVRLKLNKRKTPDGKIYIDEKRSGIYLVETVNSIIATGQFIQEVTMIKQVSPYD